MSRQLVLVLRALGLGDGLTGVPALRGLRRLAGSDARLVLAAPAGIGGWLVGQGLADELLETPDLDDVADRWRAGHGDSRPDLAVDLHGKGPRSHLLLQSLHPGRLLAWHCPAAGHPDGPRHSDDEHEVARWCRLVSWSGGPCGPEDLRLTADAAATPPAGPAGHVLVHPGAASGSRRWPADRFARVVSELIDRGERVVVTGSPGERALTARVTGVPKPAVLDLGGRLDLAGLAAVVAASRLVISGDTGVAHLATAFGSPSVLLFGPTPPAWWGPAIDLDRHRVLWHGREISGPGVQYRGDPHGSSVDPALDRIDVAGVLDAVAAVLAAVTPALPPSRVQPALA